MDRAPSRAGLTGNLDGYFTAYRIYGGRCPVSRPLRQPVVVALVNDFELVVRGLATMLRPFRDRIQVVELDLGRDPEYEVDVALFDAYGHAQLGLDRVSSLVRAPNVDAVAMYTSSATGERARRGPRRRCIRRVVEVDARGRARRRLARGRERPAGGERAVRRGPRTALARHEFGLTSRESEVAAQLAQGMSNKDIAAALWISENTVKTHLKAIFQKTLATSRSQAIVRLAGDAGFRAAAPSRPQNPCFRAAGPARCARTFATGQDAGSPRARAGMSAPRDPVGTSRDVKGGVTHECGRAVRNRGAFGALESPHRPERMQRIRHVHAAHRHAHARPRLRRACRRSTWPICCSTRPDRPRRSTVDIFQGRVTATQSAAQLTDLTCPRK